MHGGAYIGGDALNEADAFRNASMRTDAVYFFPDVRYAPFVTNPGQTEDLYVVVKELYTNPEKYGIDKNRIAIGGRSTGNTLALGTALMLQEKKEEYMLKGLYLLLPSINNLMWTD
jgi:acetyl esterase/lipase